MTAKLNPKQEAFVREYLVDLNATQAAIRAGYSEATAKQQGSRLLTHADIEEAIRSAKAERGERTEITADYVLTGIRDLIERCVQAVPVLDHEGKPTGEYKLEAAAAFRGYELLGKHLGMFATKIDLTMKDETSTVLERARRRAAETAQATRH